MAMEQFYNLIVVLVTQIYTCDKISQNYVHRTIYRERVYVKLTKFK